MRDPATSPAAELWAITTYFNPMRFRQRFDNYRIFRKELRVPLATVELAFDEGFELQSGDAELLLQLRGGAVLWQKERLLNIALQALPAECRYVAWLDCDVIFERQDWPERATGALASCALVHLYDRVHLLPPRTGPENATPASAVLTRYSSVASIASGQPVDEVLGSPTPVDGVPLGRSSGIGWAARRELIERHGFYDACIVGGGDRAMSCAAFGVSEQVARGHCMNERQRARYLAWADPFHRDVGGAVSFVAGDVYHLWHGAPENRRLRQRHEGLRPYAFDPYQDIAVGGNGCWQWATDKPELHAHVRNYFAARREDG